MKYFRFSIIYTIVSLCLAAFWGWSSGHTLESLLAALGSSLILAVLEISFSFDNAVMNATVLEKMSPIWRTIFLTIGIAVAVFGMRFLFPIVVVWLTTTLSFFGVVQEAFSNPGDYAAHLSAAHGRIAAFGGTFLFCIFLSWGAEKKEDYWLSSLEKTLEIALENSKKFLVLIVLICMFMLYAKHEVVACSFGMWSYFGVKWIADKLSDNKDAVKAGLGFFLYLELLDASFSFDGVMGAFAITQNVVLILLGLGIGAMFVRSMTVMLVETGSLKEYPYLGNGANWAIGVLGILVLLGIRVHVPEWIVGLSGTGLILWAAFTKKPEEPSEPDSAEPAPLKKAA